MTPAAAAAAAGSEGVGNVAMRSSVSTMLAKEGLWSGTAAQQSLISAACRGSVPGGISGRCPNVATFMAADRADRPLKGISRVRHSHITWPESSNPHCMVFKYVFGDDDGERHELDSLESIDTCAITQM